MLQPAIQGTLSMIEAAKSEPLVEHVVITSSFAAILDLSQWPHIGHTYSRKDWNPASKFLYNLNCSSSYDFPFC